MRETKRYIKYKCPCCKENLLLDDKKIKTKMVKLHEEYESILQEYKVLKDNKNRTESEEKQFKKLKFALRDNIEENKRYKRLRQDAKRNPVYQKEFMNYERLAMKALLDEDTYFDILRLASEFYEGTVKWEVPLMYEEVIEVENGEEVD